MGALAPCSRCLESPVTRVPVLGEPRRCASCATAFWTRLVTVGAALAELQRDVERITDPVPVDLGPVVRVSPDAAGVPARPCRRCADGIVAGDRPHATLCAPCFTATLWRGGPKAA